MYISFSKHIYKKQDTYFSASYISVFSKPHVKRVTKIVKQISLKTT